MNLTEKVAFIKGLTDGMNLDTKSKEGKIFSAIIDVLDDIALTVSNLDDDYGDLSDQVEAIDNDLHDLEEDFYYDDCDKCDDDFTYEVTCPSCNETICLSEDVLLDGQMKCPNCGENLEFDFDELCKDDCCCTSDCDCGCNDE